jgi:ubiquinone/menaquinone biosynthesis C-methylase UbiE
MDRIGDTNRRYWKSLTGRGCEYTTPWLDLDPDLVRSFAEGRLEVLPGPHACLYPRSVFEGVKGKRVLCLASGGGQQSAVFGLLGAEVTVLDLTPAQLESDRKAAEHFGFDVRTVLGDMRDLSGFAASAFDLVYQAISIVFVPDVREVYKEVARILAPGGLYRVGHCNPAAQVIEEISWDGEGYRVLVPYAGGCIEDAESMEYRHLLKDIFNGLIEAGFAITRVEEDPRHLDPPAGAQPGTLQHMLGYVQSYFAIVARR